MPFVTSSATLGLACKVQSGPPWVAPGIIYTRSVECGYVFWLPCWVCTCVLFVNHERKNLLDRFILRFHSLGFK